MALNHVYRLHKRFPDNKNIASYSDSLLKSMNSINWGIVDFVRTNKTAITAENVKKDSVNNETKSKTDLIANIQKENNFKNYDTAYYKEVFVDLFMNDIEFLSKFPLTGPANTSNSGFSSYTYNKSSYKKMKKGQYLKTDSKVQKVLFLEPFYLKIDETQPEEVQYISSDEKQEKLIVTVNECAKKQDFELVTLDPGLISTNEVDKINDYSVINDWFSEKFDATSDNQLPIFNTNEIDYLIAKYGTQYVFKTGFVNYKSRRGKKRTYYYGFLYDIKINKIIYKKYETFTDRDSKDLVNAKVYQTFYELKHFN
jgi:hypothetical protein